MFKQEDEGREQGGGIERGRKRKTDKKGHKIAQKEKNTWRRRDTSTPAPDISSERGKDPRGVRDEEEEDNAHARERKRRERKGSEQVTVDVEALSPPPHVSPRTLSGSGRQTVCHRAFAHRPLNEGVSGAMARAGQRTTPRQDMAHFLLRCNLSPEAQKVVVFVIMMLLVIINVVLMFLLAFQ